MRKILFSFLSVYLAGLLSLLMTTGMSSSIDCCLCYNGKAQDDSKEKIGHDGQKGLQQPGRQGEAALQLSLRYLEGDVQDHG